jgi:hypothetical protein
MHCSTSSNTESIQNNPSLKRKRNTHSPTPKRLFSAIESNTIKRGVKEKKKKTVICFVGVAQFFFG